MARLVKLLGLDRGESGSSGAYAGRGFRLPSAHKQKVGGTGVVAASREVGTANDRLRVSSKYGGAVFNGIGFQIGTGGGATPVISTTIQSDGLPNILVTCDATTTANEVIALINGDVEASQWVVADRPNGDGTANVVAAANADLTGGNNGTGSSDAPVLQRVTAKNVVVVDLDDAATLRLVRRNAGRFVSLGGA